MVATGASAATLSFEDTALLVNPNEVAAVSVDVLLTTTGNTLDVTYRLQDNGDTGLVSLTSVTNNTLFPSFPAPPAGQPLDPVNDSALGGALAFGSPPVTGTDLLVGTVNLSVGGMDPGNSVVIQLVGGPAGNDAPKWGDDMFMSYDMTNVSTLTITATPEPASALLLLLGGVFAMRRRRA